MPGLTRYPFKVSNTALYNPSESTVFAAINPSATVTFTVPITRNFKPYKQTRVYFPAGLPSGLAITNVNITGNAPSYTLTYSIYNGTSSVITPATQPVIFYQED